jgi:tRNA (cytidine/uridine-2'-O-)-methyltransferase
MIRIALIHPDIPQNTGNVGRLCVGLDTELHLVHPMGFVIDDKRIRRSGLDYWKDLKLIQHDSLGAFLDFTSAPTTRKMASSEDRFLVDSGTCAGQKDHHSNGSSTGAAHLYFFTTKAKKNYTDVKFRDGDFLVFGSESRGLPDELLEEHREHAVTIPMFGPIRSLNLATSVGIVAYEAVRQLCLASNPIEFIS